MIDFTVVVPVYNTAPDHLLECISSILNQSIVQDFNVTILNDGSTNVETLRMIKYLSKNNRVKVVTIKENGGVAAALNYFHKITPNKYIAVCGSDDIFHKDKLKMQVEWLEKNPDTSVLSTQLFGFKNSDIERKSLFRSSHALNCNPKSDTNYWIANHGTVIYKNADVVDAGGYNDAIKRGQDVDLWKRMYDKGYKFQCLPDILYAWRRYL